MGVLTNIAQNAILDALLRGQQLVTPRVWYVALVTTEGATNALAGVEVSGGAYKRVAINADMISWSGTQADGSTGISIGSSAVTSNNGSITFPTPTANWGVVVSYELWDQAVNGARWFYDILTVPKTVSAGDPAVTFPPGELRLSFI